MNNERTSVPWTFTVIGAIALLWHMMGVVNFFAQMNPDSVASYPESHQAIIEGRPTWATTGFAVSVFGGALGAVLLLMKKSVAVYVFVASMAGTVATMVHTIRVARGRDDFGTFENLMMIAMPLVVGAFLIWYSLRAKRKGWAG